MAKADPHPGWKLSRECICDTFLAKRTGIFKQRGSGIAAICQRNLRLLRETQLAPHQETKLVANRYWLRQTIKKHHPHECACCANPFDPSEYVLRGDNPNVLALCKDEAFLCKSCLKTVLFEAEGTAEDCCIVFISGGIVYKMVLPENPDTFLVADHDVFDGGESEEKRDFFVRCLMARRPRMHTIQSSARSRIRPANLRIG